MSHTTRLCPPQGPNAGGRAALSRFIQCLLRDRQGGALIEASLIIPFGIMLFLGVSEFAQGFTVNRRVEAAAGTAADLVSRQQAVTTAELDAIRTMLDEMIRPYSPDTLRLRLTSIVVDGVGQATVSWSYASGSGLSAQLIGTNVSIPSGLVPPNGSIIYAETEYTFQSTLATLIPGGIELRGESYFPPRVGNTVEFED